jgi:hypothetical protein
MNILLWILQVLLAAQFLWHGWLYVAPPPEMVDAMKAFIAPELRFFIGTAEILAAVGLLVPGITRTSTWLTPLAAAGLMIVVGSATILHLSRGETGNALYVAVLFVLVTFVAYMRWKVKPLMPRQTVQSSV